MTESNEGYTIKISTNIPFLKNKALVRLTLLSLAVILFRWIAVGWLSNSSLYVFTSAPIMHIDILSYGILAVAVTVSCIYYGKHGLLASILMISNQFLVMILFIDPIEYFYMDTINYGSLIGVALLFSIFMFIVAFVMTWISSRKPEAGT